MDVATELYEISRRNGGLVTTANANDRGIPRQRLHDLAHHGQIARIAHGVYSIGAPTAPHTTPLALTARRKLVLSHESAASWLGVDLPARPHLIHVTAPRNRGLRHDAIAGVRLHRANLGPGDVLEVRGVHVTSPLRTALDIARSSSLEHAVAAVDSFLRARQLMLEEFVTAANAAAGPRRQRLRLVAALIDPKSGSVLESLTRVLLWRNNIAPPTSQYPFTHPTRGWIGWVDFAWPELRVILECDGYEFHAARGPFQKDRRRWSAVGSAGWHLAVVTWFDVTCEPDYVVELVRDLLGVEA